MGFLPDVGFPSCRKSVSRLAAALAALAALAAVGHAPQALAQEAGASAGVDAFAQAMVDYAEGHFADAAHGFARSMGRGLRPEALEMMARSYEAMGFCDAARRQHELLGRWFPARPSAALQACDRQRGSTARLQVRHCPDPQTWIALNAMFAVPCGETVEVVAGRYTLVATASGQELGALLVEAEAGTDVMVSLSSLKPPPPAHPAPAPAHFTPWQPLPAAQHTTARPMVDRLVEAESPYTVFRTIDGLYEIWLSVAQGSSEGALSGASVGSPGARVAIVCGDSPEDLADQGCKLLDEFRQKARGGEGARPARMFIPRVP